MTLDFNHSQSDLDLARTAIIAARSGLLDRLWPTAKADLESDYRQWLCTLLPAHFRAGPDLQFAAHQREFWGWAWQPKPPTPAAMLLWNRGGCKSTSVEALAVASGAQEWRKYALIVARTQEQADLHVGGINSMLLDSRVGLVYPQMAKPRMLKLGSNSRQQGSWNRQCLTTDAGWTVQGFGLLGALRGIRMAEYRPDLIVITDIDKLNDSVGMAQTLLDALAADVLATVSNDALVIFDQNLIHRGSVANQIYTRQTDVLSERRVFGPIPALAPHPDVKESPQYERREEKWHILSGLPTWPGGMNVAQCEVKLNLWGKDTWEREAQHNINLPYPDAQYPMFDPVYHFITWEEFARPEIFGTFARDESGRPRLPGNNEEYGLCAQAQDWGNNHKHPCATRWAWRPSAYLSLTDSVFFYREMCWPKFPKVEGDDRAHPSAVQVGREIWNIEKLAGWNESMRMQFRVASHERPEIQEAYRTDLPAAGIDPMTFQPVDTAQAREGILHMQSFLTIIPDEPHPFRRYPAGHPQEGEPLMGRPRCYWITEPGQGELIWLGGKLDVTPSTNEAGQARTAFEYPNYRKPDTQEGAEKRDAPKLNDDIVDCDRAIAGRLFPSIAALTSQQRIELRLKILGWGREKAPADRTEAIFFGMGRDYYGRTMAAAEPEKAKWGLGKRQEGDYPPAGPEWEVAID